jgi:hypothetical protein
MPQTVSTQPTPANVQKLIKVLEATTPAFEVFAKHLADLRQPLALDKRSLLEELVHLIHCEARLSEAIYLALIADKPLLTDVHPEHQWGHLMRFDCLPFDELLSYFGVRRVILLGVLSKLPEQAWLRTVRESSKKRQESVYWKTRTLALHEQHHINSIQVRLLP